MATNNVLLFWPNIIGYGRIILTFISIYIFKTHPILTIACYATSQLLDAADGYAARKFNQSSDFGALLDMVTDRVSIAAFLACLTQMFPDYSFFLIFFLVLDYSSHWFQMYSTLKTGEIHHKKAYSKFKIMNIYYQSKAALFFLCFGAELFLINLYCYGFEKYFQDLWGYNSKYINYTLFAFSTPLFLMKHFVNIIQIMSSVDKLIQADVKVRESQQGKQK